MDERICRDDETGSSVVLIASSSLPQHTGKNQRGVVVVLQLFRDADQYRTVEELEPGANSFFHRAGRCGNGGTDWSLEVSCHNLYNTTSSLHPQERFSPGVRRSPTGRQQVGVRRSPAGRQSGEPVGARRLTELDYPPRCRSRSSCEEDRFRFSPLSE